MKRVVPNLRGLILLALIATGGCVAHSPHSQAPEPSAHPAAHSPKPSIRPHKSIVLDLQQAGPMTQHKERLLAHRIIYVGESHTSMGHHLQQLEVIRLLHQADKRLGIGLEMIQNDVQSALDAFIAADIDQREMLLQTRWFDRWGYNFLMYKPIFDYAREQGIPLIALNAPNEALNKVRSKGFDQLSEAERTPLAEQLDRSDKAYEQRLRQVFDRHAGRMGKADFQRFVDVQLSWDETMARRSSEFLEQYPEHRLVVLAGAGHLAYRSGIPARVARRTGLRGLVLLPATPDYLSPKAADLLYSADDQPTPRRAMLNVLLKETEQGVVLEKLLDKGAAQRAGLEPGDLILTLGEETIHTSADLRATLMDHAPGDQLQVTFRRSGFFGTKKTMTVPVELGGP